MFDPRKAKTLDEASKNDDGTYSGVNALSWLSEVISPGRGISREEVKTLWNKVRADKGLPPQ